MDIYLDENLPPDLAKGLNHLIKVLNPAFDVKHIKQRFPAGTADQDWIKELSADKASIITCDLRIFSEIESRSILANSKVGLFFYCQPKKKGASFWEMAVYLVQNLEKILDFETGMKKPFGIKMYPKRNMEILRLSK